MSEEHAERLKRDAFGAIFRVHADGRTFIRRDTRAAHPALRFVARAVAAREARALERLAPLAGVPRLLRRDRDLVERSYIEGAPMQEAPPLGDVAYFRAARRLLLALHARGIAHNDLAKEPNWLVTTEGAPAIVDFQLATTSERHGKLFRLLAWEDLRHLLKHKRTYCPEALTPVERRVLARRSWLSRAWSASGKRAYNFVTRRIFDWRDGEGRGASPTHRAGPPR